MVKIFFPGWIVRIGCSLNLDMPFDRNIPQLVEGDLLHALLVLPSLYLTIEMPLLVPHGAKIALFHPSSPLAGVPSFGPPPQTVEDGTIHTLKGGFAHDMPVIVAPSPQQRIEHRYQFASRELLVVFDETSYFRQQGVDAFAGRCD